MEGRVILANGCVRHASGAQARLEGVQFGGGEAEDDGESSGWERTRRRLAGGMDNLCGEQPAWKITADRNVVCQLTVKLVAAWTPS